MTNRREIETLFQRMGATPAIVTTEDDAIADDAARAVQDWPLLAMLTLGHRAAPHRAPIAATPLRAVPPVQSVAPAMSEPVMPLTQPAAPAAAVQPAVIPPAPPLAAPATATEDPQLSPLEQLFRRAEQTGKPAAAQPAVVAPPTQAAPMAPAASFMPPTPAAPLMAPPPLKIPTQPRLGPLVPRPAAAPQLEPVAAAEGSVTIEPKPRQWRQLDTVPAALFDRVGAR